MAEDLPDCEWAKYDQFEDRKKCLMGQKIEDFNPFEDTKICDLCLKGELQDTLVGIHGLLGSNKQI